MVNDIAGSRSALFAIQSSDIVWSRQRSSKNLMRQSGVNQLRRVYGQTDAVMPD